MTGFRPSAPGANAYELQIPADPGVTLPGPYMPFALNKQGVPSKAALLTINEGVAHINSVTK
ncbi:galactose oxidase-like domain-containing protein [Streptomyces lunaelactis]|uniref:galactose oxidase-like domain-containing protein n=1 Tax=Streptomyces lunaelactis TaxID=1535768 RepID=UPI00211D92CD|nr:galactose oxidase-like domain-containing protein [Streptomyces lunaelactis]